MEYEQQAYWDRQSQLPLLKRDLAWWSEVALTNLVVWIVAAIITAAAVATLVGLF